MLSFRAAIRRRIAILSLFGICLITLIANRFSHTTCSAIDFEGYYHPHGTLHRRTNQAYFQEPSWNSGATNSAAELVDKLIDEFLIDKSRIYLIGYSMGAYGCWKYAASKPKRFAPMIAVGGSEADAKKIAQTPICAIHGIDDQVVPISESEKMVNAI